MNNEKVCESVIRQYVEETLDHSNPRNWYYALMDYGAYLKKTVGNLNKFSKYYTKQSKFEGSKRQLRAKILKALLNQDMTLQQLQVKFEDSQYSVEEVVNDLVNEGMVFLREGLYTCNTE